MLHIQQEARWVLEPLCMLWKRETLLLPSSAKVKITWSPISTLPHAFKARYSNEALYRELLER